MTPSQKIQYVKDKIDEKIALSPTGPCQVRVITVREGKFDSPALMTREEQATIYKKFEEEGYIKNLKVGFGASRIEFEKGSNNLYKTNTNDVLKAGPSAPKVQSQDLNSRIITKKDADFYYKGKFINLSKKADYYKVFCALYAKLPDGGEISYKDLISEIKSRIPKTVSWTDDQMQKLIQRNLNDKSNGFMRYAEIPETEDHGKPLIQIIRGSGVIFNNKAG